MPGRGGYTRAVELWRKFLRAFGFSSGARVRITAPGIDVVLQGDPDTVRALLAVVRGELDRRRRRSAVHRPLPGIAISESQFVRPTELDETDSPYALPEAIVRPVDEEELTTDKRALEERRRVSWPATEPPSESVTATDDHVDPVGRAPTTRVPRPGGPTTPLDPGATSRAERAPKYPFADLLRPASMATKTAGDDKKRYRPR